MRPSLQPLEHPNRDLLFRLVEARPGVHFRTLATESSLGVGNTRHHLDVLVAAGLIALRRNGGRLHCFAAARFQETTWRAQAELADPRSDRLARLVGLLGAPRQADVVEGAKERWAWSRTGTQERLRRLVNEGIVEAPRRRGGSYRLA